MAGATGDATAANQTTILNRIGTPNVTLATDLAAQSATAIDTVLTGTHGAGSWGAGGDATAANQATILANLAALPAALLDLTDGVETDVTPRQALRLLAAVTGGIISGAAGTTVSIRDLGDSKDRVIATVDADGNRSVVTLDLT